MDIRIGKITHYFDKISVAVLELYDILKVEDMIHIRGRTTDFTQKVDSLEVEHQKIQSAGPKDEVALKVIAPVREGDMIYKESEE